MLEEDRHSQPSLRASGYEPFRLGEWFIFPELNRIERDEQSRSLEPKVMDVLLYLAARPGRVVSKAELLDRVWPGEHVTDYVLSRCISELRKAFDEDHRDPDLIETVRKRGYRLLARPQPADVVAQAPSVEAKPRTAHKGWVFILVLLAVVTMTLWFLPIESETPAVPEPPVPLTTLPGMELDPALSPEGSQFAFAWKPPTSSHFDIYVQSLRGAVPRRITTHAAPESNPVWSPDGKALAYVRSDGDSSGIFLTDIDSLSTRRLVATWSGDIPDLSWSAARNRLYFVDRPQPDRPFSVFEFDLETSHTRQITEPPVHYFGDRDLALSADGTKLAVARALVPGLEQLLVVDVDSGDIAELTRQMSAIAGIEWLEEEPAILFSADHGPRARFWRLHTKGGSLQAAGTSLESVFDPSTRPRTDSPLLFEYKVLETDIRRVSLPQKPGAGGTPEVVIRSTRWEIYPDITRGGDRLLFLSNRTGTPDVWAADLDGENLSRLTQGNESGLAFAVWAPDGTRIAYSAWAAGSTQIFMKGIQSSRPVPLTADRFNKLICGWSADANRVYLASDRTGEWQIWSVAVDGGNLEQITFDGAIFCKESSDGRFLYWTRMAEAGLWRTHLNSGSVELVLKTPPLGAWQEWALGQEGIYYRTRRGHRYAIEYQAFLGTPPESIVEDAGGTAAPGLGLAVTPAEDQLYFVQVSREESDIQMLTKWR